MKQTGSATHQPHRDDGDGEERANSLPDKLSATASLNLTQLLVPLSILTTSSM